MRRSSITEQGDIAQNCISTDSYKILNTLKFYNHTALGYLQSDRRCNAVVMLDERLQDQLCIRTHSPLILIRLYIFYAEALTLASFDFIDFMERMLK